MLWTYLLAVVAQPDMFVYNASKGGVLQLTRCLAMDLAQVRFSYHFKVYIYLVRWLTCFLFASFSFQENIRVNAICPGSILTPAAYKHMNYLGKYLRTSNHLAGDEEIFFSSPPPTFILNNDVIISTIFHRSPST